MYLTLRMIGVFVAAAFACGCGASTAPAAWPHHQQVASGVHAIGFADKYRSANCGLVETPDGTLLIDLPRGIPVAQFLAEVKTVTKNPVAALILTQATADDAPLVDELRKLGVKRVILSPQTSKSLRSGAPTAAAPAEAKSVAPAVAPGDVIIDRDTKIGEFSTAIHFLPLDDISTAGAAAVWLPVAKVLFAGPAVIHGPRVPLPGNDTQAWREALDQLSARKPEHVVPGFGSWGGAELLDRQQHFLTELRRQVGYFVAQARPREDLMSDIRLVPNYLVWMPYDTPLAEDVGHVYQELTVPQAPFGARPPRPEDKQPHALVLIGDQPHEPGHIEAGLRPVFAAAGVTAHFTVDVQALSAENLARVQLLVILRDGLQRPQHEGQPDYVWMTREQETAVVDFVHRGGAFLNLHNSMGLYPEDGPYLKLVGGRYIGHGPLERFRVEVVDRDHPVTRGVEDFSVADEQHTPPCDETRVHVLLRNRSDDGQTAAAGWVYEPGRGRLCHLANGHTRESLLHPMYQRLMRNAVLWCLRREPHP